MRHRGIVFAALLPLAACTVQAPADAPVPTAAPRAAALPAGTLVDLTHAYGAGEVRRRARRAAARGRHRAVGGVW